MILLFPEEQRASVVKALNTIDGVRVMEPSPVFNHEYFTFDSRQHTIRANGKSVHLAPVESRLMSLLALNVNEVVTKEDLICFALQTDVICDSDMQTLKTHVYYLRRKLDPIVDGSEAIERIVKVGYKLVDKSLC